MLSPGKSYLKVPKGLEENLLFRRWVLDRADQNKRIRDGLRDTCKHDLLFYVNAFGWTFDPRLAQKIIPFITYPFQDRTLVLGDPNAANRLLNGYSILQCIEDQRDLVMFKSRDMGASWMSLVSMQWCWLFHPGMSFLIISRKAELVDKPGDPKALFWKLDFFHKCLPEWLLNPDDYARRAGNFENLTNHSTIDGESTTGASGVGDRRTGVFIDEFSRIERPDAEQLLAGTADTTECRIFNYTVPIDSQHPSVELAKREDVRKIRLHWTEHPEKAEGLYRYSPQLKRVEQLDLYPFPADYTFVTDGKMRSPWYDDQERRRANKREMAWMIDIDFEGATYQFFEKALLVELQQQYCCRPYWEGMLNVDPVTGQDAELVEMEGGPIRLWCNLDSSNRPPLSVYGAGADISLGVNATNSSFSVVNRKTGEKVLDYSTCIVEPKPFATICVALCRLFKSPEDVPAQLAWEVQGPGIAFGKRVMELGFRDIYWRKNEQKMGEKIKNEYPGWNPSPENKLQLMLDYRTALVDRRLINRCHEALEECNQFQFTTQGRLEHAAQATTSDRTAAKDNHADRVIADALACKMANLDVAHRPAGDVRTDAPRGSLAWRRQRIAALAAAREDW